MMMIIAIITLIIRPALGWFPSEDWLMRIRNSMMAVAPPGTSQVSNIIVFNIIVIIIVIIVIIIVIIGIIIVIINVHIIGIIIVIIVIILIVTIILIQVFPMMCGTCSNENGIKLMFMR